MKKKLNDFINELNELADNDFEKYKEKIKSMNIEKIHILKTDKNDIYILDENVVCNDSIECFILEVPIKKFCENIKENWGQWENLINEYSNKKSKIGGRHICKTFPKKFRSRSSSLPPLSIDKQIEGLELKLERLKHAKKFEEAIKNAFPDMFNLPKNYNKSKK